MSLFRKEAGPIPYETDPRFGERANTALMVNLLSSNEVLSKDDFRQLDPSVQGMFSAFAKVTYDSVVGNDPRKLHQAFINLRAHASHVDTINERMLMSSPEVAQELVNQVKTFETEISHLFPHNIVERDGHKIVSTRTGGPAWWLKQGILTIATPIPEATITTKKIGRFSKPGKGTTINNKEISLKIDPGLFDDMVQLHSDGIHIINPDRGEDETVIPWDQSRSLTFGTDATVYVDWINRIFRPMSKKTAQSQFVPWGTFTIKDRQSGATLVTALLLKPFEFRKSLEKLRNKMAPTAARVEKLEAMAPIDIADAINLLPSYMREKAAELLGFDLEEQKYNSGRHHRLPLLIEGKRSSIFMAVFRGEEFADWGTCLIRIQEAISNIPPEWREHASDRNKFLQAMKSIVIKMKPFAKRDWNTTIDIILHGR